MRVAVSTDSNSGIKTAREGLYLMNLPITVNGVTTRENEGITARELFGLMKEHAAVGTSQPSPDDLTQAWERAFKDGYDEVVHVPITSAVSGASEVAAAIAREYNGKVQVPDNKRISVTQEEAVNAALELAAQGYSALEIKNILEKNAENAIIFIAVDSLEYLIKGGRIKPIMGAVANVLNIKPVISFDGNSIKVLSKARGIKKAELAMLDAMEKELSTRFAGVPQEELIMFTAGTFEDKKDSDIWLEFVRNRFPQFDVDYSDLSASVSCHVGPEAAGIAVVKRTKAE